MDNNNRNAACPDYVVCTCMGVMYSEIIAALDKGYITQEMLKEYLLVGTGCNTCVPEIDQIIEAWQKSK